MLQKKIRVYSYSKICFMHMHMQVNIGTFEVEEKELGARM